MYDSRRLRGWNRFTGGSLVTFASILVRLQAKREGADYVLASFNKIYAVYDSRRLRGWNRFTIGSLVAFASISVRLEMKQEGGKYFFGAFQQIYAVYDSRRLRRWNRFTGGFWFASKRNGRLMIMFWRLSTNLCCV